jgi:hypothetical protein
MPAEGHRLTDQLLTPESIGIPRLYALRPDLFRMTERDGVNIDVDRIKRQWGHRFNDAARPILLDDSPPNAARCRWLQRHFEPASFLFLIRNGYAVSEGIRRRAGHTIDLAATQWVRSNQFMLEDLPHLERVHMLRYEDLSEKPDETLARTLLFLDVDPSNFTVSGEVWRVHGRSRRVSNMNEESLDRLTQEDRIAIERAAGPLLREFGYFVGEL